VPAHWREGFRRVGVSHLLAVSGLHVGMVAGLVVVLGVRVPRTVRLLAMLTACGAYALLVGPRPSLLRAVLMVALGATALLLRRPPQPLNALGAAVLILLADDPSWLGELGFQLSVAATAGILLLAPIFNRWLEALPLRPPSLVAAALSVTVAAQLATLPWSLAAFHRLCPMAPVVNLVAIPWAALSLSTSLLWAAARLASPPLTPLLESALDLLAMPCEWVAGLPPSAWWSVPVVVPWPLAVVAAGLLISAVLRPGPLAWWLPRVAMAGLLMAWGPGVPRHPGVEVVFFDVGQGDGILLRDGREALLMDAGGWAGPGFGARVMLPALAGLGVRRLTALGVSHPHRDHCGGIADLARELPTREVWVADRLEGSACGEELAAVPGLTWRVLAVGEELSLGRWHLQVLGPLAGAGASPNDRSLVLRAEALGRSVLLTGDTEARGERLLVRRWGERLAVDLLKVGHHGSRTSTTAELLALSSPRVAVLSAGRNNRHNHPSPQVVAALHRRRVLLLRTDRDGMVRARWEGPQHWRIETEGP
jgi:competence protein ComEC